jgi:hypothetical protein
MHDNANVPACLVRRVHAYGAGRSNGPADMKQIASETEAFAASGYRWRALLRGMLSDPQFYSVSPPEGVHPRVQAARASGEGDPSGEGL